MPREHIKLSVPDMQCSGCEGAVSLAIQETLENSSAVLTEIKINSYEKIIDITVTANKGLNENQLTLTIKEAIFKITGKNAYTIGCDLELTEKAPATLSYIPDKWFLIKPVPPVTEWQLFQVDSLAKRMNAIPIADIPKLAAALQKETFDEDHIRDLLFSFQQENRNKVRTAVIRGYWFRALFSMSLSLILLILSVLGVAPFIYLIAGGISAFFTICIGLDTYYQAGLALYYTRQLTIDSLFTVSTLAILTVSFLAIFFPGLNWQPMFDMALLIFGFKYFGIALVEDKVNKPTVAAKFSNSVPLYHQVDVEDEYKENKPSRKVAVRDLKPGDIILIKQGKLIPVDGVACKDLTVVSTLSNHGDVDAVKKKVGDFLQAGMKISGNDDNMKAEPCRIRVTRTANDSYLMRLDRESKAEQKSSSVSTHATNYIIPLIFILAIVTGIIFGFYFPLLKAFQLSISMLISFCPCTLGLVDALSSITATHKLQKKDMTLKNSDLLKKIKKNVKVAFDLVGTLTSGKHEVLQMHLNPAIQLPELKKIIYALEKNQEHSVSRAICQYLKSENPEIENFKDIQRDHSFHMGIKATIGEFVYYIGNDKMMEEYHIPITGIQYEEKKGSEPVTQVIYVARKKKSIESKMDSDKTIEQLEETVEGPGELLALLQLTDPLRPEVISTLLLLQAMEKELAIYSGSSWRTLKKYLEMLKEKGINIQDAKAECVNSESEKKGIYLTKSEVVAQARVKDENLIMVGEGENDALAMPEASVGIAMESDSQSSVTHSKAHIIIKSADALLTLFAVADMKEINEKQNICIAVIFNIIAMMLPMILMMSGCSLFPMMSLLAMFMSLILIIANNERFKRQAICQPSPAIPSENMSTLAWIAKTLRIPALVLPSAMSLSDEAKQEEYQQKELFFQRDFSFRQIDPCLAHSKFASSLAQQTQRI